MNGEMIYVLSVMTVAGMLFASGKMRLDVVALLVVLSLVLRGTLTPTKAFAGFGEPIIILVAGLLVISDMLARAGVAHHIGNWLACHAKDGETQLLLLLMLVVAVLAKNTRSHRARFAR